MAGAGVASALPCYERQQHTPAAVAEFEAAKRQAAREGSWLLPALGGVALGLLTSFLKGACKARGRGYRKAKAGEELSPLAPQE